MDPNETLRRWLIARQEAENATDYTDEREDALAQAAEAANDLFEWLSNGGFQPEWARVAAEVLGS